MKNEKDNVMKHLDDYARGHIEKHKANVEVYINQSVGIGEHSDIIESIEKELNHHSTMYEDQLEVLDKIFQSYYK